MAVRAGGSPVPGRTGWQNDDVVAMIWRWHGQMRTYVDSRVRSDPDIAAWIDRAVRQGEVFDVIYCEDVPRLLTAR